MTEKELKKKYQQSDLLGVWTLISFSTTDKNETIYPYGKEAVGYLIYTADHIVSVHMMSSNRLKTNNHQYQSGTDSEKIETAENFAGYVGQYELLGNIITHIPKVCSFPSLIKKRLKRKIFLYEKHLTLSYKSPNGEEKSILVWEKQN